jgi:hypothetical protein
MVKELHQERAYYYFQVEIKVEEDLWELFFLKNYSGVSGQGVSGQGVLKGIHQERAYYYFQVEIKVV